MSEPPSLPKPLALNPPQPAVVRRSQWWRLLVCEALQVPAVALVVLSPHPSAWWVAGIWGSCCSCAATDSQWRWRNRALVGQAVVWLVGAAVFGSSGSVHLHAP